MITSLSIQIITAAILLGLTAGFSPGPLTTLVLTQTIKHNRKEGIKVAMSPLFTDLPIILLSLFIFNRFSQFDTILAIISFIGGGYIVHLGISTFRTKELNVEIGDDKPGSLKSGIITNFLSPNAYLFWATVGAPFLFKAYAVNLITAVLFLISFYVLLIGSKIMIAVIISKTKHFIGDKLYRYIMRFFGVALFVFAILFFVDGIKYLGF